MGAPVDWNDLKYFISVADHGSTLRAAGKLRVSQTTVARRVAALEQSTGLQLFERRSAGYALTADGEALLAQAHEVAAAADSFASAAASRGRDLRGTVRLSLEEIFAITLFSPILRDLHDLHPDIHIELDTAEGLRVLAAGEADIVLRSSVNAEGAGLVGRRLCSDDWTLYCSRDYAARHGVPRSRADLKGHSLIGGGGGNVWRAYSAWLHDLGVEDQVAMHHASSAGLLSAAHSGVGLTVLPCIAADSDPDLVRCFPPRKDHGRSLWLLTHDRVRHTPRVRTVIDFLYERLKARVNELSLAT